MRACNFRLLFALTAAVPMDLTVTGAAYEKHAGRQVGRAGSAVGIDIKSAAVQLGRVSVQGLVRADPEFARQAAPLRFYTHNVFMPSLRHKVARLHPVTTLLTNDHARRLSARRGMWAAFLPYHAQSGVLLGCLAHLWPGPPV